MTQPKNTLLSPRANTQILLFVIVTLLLIVSKFAFWAEAKLSDPARAFVPASGPASSAQGTAPSATQSVNYDAMPISFEPNQGQAAAPIQFLARGKGYNLLFAGQEIAMTLRKEVTAMREAAGAQRQYATETIRWKFVGANPHPEITAEEALPGRSNYFVGSDPAMWRTNIQTYARVRYRNLYPGIDLVFYGSQGQLEYDFILAPGANPQAIQLAFSGTTDVAITAAGNLRLQTAQGGMEQLAPVVYQTIDGQRREIKGKYKKVGRQQIAFTLGKYDVRQPLTIDPVLIYSTYYGGNNQDQGLGIALDKDGNVYVTGDTLSTDFSTANGLQNTNGGTTDAYVVKLNAAGTSVLYATYLGGNGADTGNAITVDANGNAYVTGQSGSNNFPGTSQSPRVGPGGAVDAFVSKLNPTGSAIVYTTFIGGNNLDTGNAIAVDADGNAYLAGRTDSTNLPATGFQVTKTGSPLFKSSDQASSWSKNSTGITAASVQTFVLHPTDTNIIYAGSSSGLFKSTDQGATWRQPPGAANNLSLIHGIAIDPVTPDNVYVGTSLGIFKSTNGGETFQRLTNGLPINNLAVVYAVVIAPNNSSLLYVGTALGVFKSVDAGESWSAVNNGLRISAMISNVPTVTKLVMNPTNPATLYAGTISGVYRTTDGGTSWIASNEGLNDFVGSPTGPAMQSLALDPANPNTLYAGTNNRGFFKTTNGGANWQRIEEGLLVDNQKGTINAIAIARTNPMTVYIGGQLGVFKTTNGGSNWQRVVNGLTNITVQALIVSNANPTVLFAGIISGSDAFITKLNAQGSAATWLTYLGGEEFDDARGLAVDATGSVYLAGVTTSTNFPATPNALQTKMGGIGDGFVAKLNPAGTGLTYATYLGGTSGDIARGIALNAQGEAFVTGQAGAANFPTLNSIQPFGLGAAQIAGGDAYVVRLKADGSGLVYGTFLGGSHNDVSNAIALDASGNAYITGSTQSLDFPIKGAFQTALGGSTDAFVAKVSATGTTLLHGSYLGGFSSDVGNGIAVDKNGDAHVVGNTTSTNFPIVNSLQPVRSGSNIFIVKLGSATDLAVTMTASAETVNLGENLTYTVQVANNGELAATDVKLTDQLPAAATVVSTTSSQGTCSGTGPINCSLGTVASGALATISVVIKPPAIPTIMNSVSVTSTEKDANDANNTASISTKVLFADLALFVTQSHLQIEPGKKLTWVVSVKNNGPLTAKTIVVTNNLPAELEFVSCQALGKGVCGGTGNNRVLTVAELEFGSAETFILEGKIKDSSPAGTIITHQASVVAAPPDNVLTNNQQSSTVTIIKPDLVPAKNGKLAFLSPSGSSEIIVMNPDGSGRFRFQSGSSPVWSPDGLMLAFTNSSYELMVINADGTGLRKLPVSAPYPSSPTWSPDGTRIAFYGPFGLYTINVDGTNERRLTEVLPTLQANGRLRWSPDGSRFLFGNSGWNNGGIATIYLDGTGFTPLTRPADNSRVSDLNPSWSPDGTTIVFARSQFFASANIYVMNADGTGTKQLTTGTFQEDAPIFSPDGKQIAFSRNGEIWMMNADGTNQRQISNQKPQYGLSHIDWQRVPSVPQVATFVISGRLTIEGPRSVYPKIELTGTRTATTTIEADGVYSFGNLPVGGTYTITMSDPSFQFTPAARTFTNLQTDQPNADVTAAFAGRTINGRIVDDVGVAIEGVRVWLYSNGSFNVYATTDANGNYSFSDLQSGVDYTVNPLGYASNEIYTPSRTSFTALSANQTANFVGKREKLSLRATVVDAAGVAVSGVTITVSGGASNSSSATTDSMGIATLSDVLSGFSYTVTAKKDNLTIGPAARRIVFNKNWEMNFYSGISAAATVSSASYSQQPVTPDGIVSLFGTGLAAAPKLAENGLVYNLDGVTVNLEGTDGLVRSCLLFYVSPTQINFLLPTEAPSGEAVITVSRANKPVGVGAVQIAAVAPGMFSMNQNGAGPAASLVVRVKAGNEFVYAVPHRYDAATQKYISLPIDLGPDLGNDTDQVFLELYGTGIRKRSSLANVTAKIGGVSAEVSYAGSQNYFAGLDQVNVKIPRSLMGRGEVEIELSVDGKIANLVKINIK